MEKKEYNQLIELHLVLKRKWYDMIDVGIKREEYRDLTQYWFNRIGKYLPFMIKTVVLHRAYSSTTMRFECTYDIGIPNPEWIDQTEVYKMKYRIKLLKRL